MVDVSYFTVALKMFCLTKSIDVVASWKSKVRRFEKK